MPKPRKKKQKEFVRESASLSAVVPYWPSLPTEEHRTECLGAFSLALHLLFASSQGLGARGVGAQQPQKHQLPSKKGAYPSGRVAAMVQSRPELRRGMPMLPMLHCAPCSHTFEKKWSSPPDHRACCLLWRSSFAPLPFLRRPVAEVRCEG